MIENLVVGAIATNCWIVETKSKNCVVVDPGGDGEAIIARLRRRKLHPTHIVLTHGHFDHVAALPAVYAAFAGDQPPIVAIHAADASYLGPESKAPHLRDFRGVGAAEYVETLWSPMPAASRILEDGDTLDCFAVIHTPGHTPGSICLYDDSEGLLITGDTLFAGGVGRTDLYGGDSAALGRSLQRILSLPPDVRIYPGHGDDSKIGRER